MKTIFRINLTADKWKTVGAVFVAKAGDGKGGYYTGGENYKVPKALKAVRESLTMQNRNWTETNGEDGYLTITAE